MPNFMFGLVWLTHRLPVTVEALRIVIVSDLYILFSAKEGMFVCVFVCFLSISNFT